MSKHFIRNRRGDNSKTDTKSSDKGKSKESTAQKSATKKPEANKLKSQAVGVILNILVSLGIIGAIIGGLLLIAAIVNEQQKHNFQAAQRYGGKDLERIRAEQEARNSTPQLAQTMFFDPNEIKVPEGYELLGPVRTDGSEVEYTMPKTGTVEVCFRGAHDAPKKGAYGQAIYINNNYINLATMENACKEYGLVEEGTVFKAGWSHPDQSMLQRGLASGRLREPWPEPILVYKPE